MKRPLAGIDPTGKRRPMAADAASRPTRPARPRVKRKAQEQSMEQLLKFAVPVDEKSHLLVLVELREFEPVNRSWCVAGRCQRWRGQYEEHGLYTRTVVLGDEFTIVVRAGPNISDAIDKLARVAVNKSTRGA